MIDRSKIEALVRAALVELRRSDGAAPGGSPVEVEVEVDAADALLIAPDRGQNLAAPADRSALAAMLKAQPARIGVGRAGVRYRTNTLLRFRADHAAARDAVEAEVSGELLARLGLFEVHTRAESKRHFLLRPDAGRALSTDARAEIARRVPRAPKVQIIYGDGLSAAALNEHLEVFHGALVRELAAGGLAPGPALFVRYSRVKVMDEIARLVDAEAALFVCGERPGLGFADSLSAYYIYRPGEGATDANREVISNINPRGLEPVRAAKLTAEALARVLRERRSGVVLA
jgi:ethanolamine ammonia-lyase small subunit